MDGKNMTYENVLTRFGKIIRKFRETAGIKQGDFARQIGINQSDLSAFENHGKKIQNVEDIEMMFNLLGFTLIPTEKKRYLS